MMNPHPQTDIYFQLLRKFEVETQERQGIIDNDEKSAQQLSLLTGAFLRHFVVLRAFGNNPFYFTKVKHGQTNVTYIRFDYKKFSGLTLLSFFLNLLYISGFVILAYRLFNGDYQASRVPGTIINAKHSSTEADGLMKAFLSSFFLACGVGCVSSFITSSKLSRFLNKWKDFVFDFSKIFEGRIVKFERMDQISKVFYAYTLGLFSFYAIRSVYVYKACIFNIHNNCTWLEREQSFILVGFSCQSILNTTYEYSKLGMMLHTVSQALYQVKLALNDSKEDFSSGKTNTRDLFNLIYGIREQTKLLMEIFGTSLLFILFFIFTLIINTWMLLMQFADGDVAISLVLSVGSIGLIQVLRFAGLAFLAEIIANREKLVLEEISSMEMHTLKEQIEVQIFINLLTKKPSEFTLNNIIPMRRSIFLALMSNSATYLIATMQLFDASQSDLVGASSSLSNLTQSSP